MYDDELLSILLQNEMFQREVALTLGRQNPLTYAGTLPQRGSPPYGNTTSHTYAQSRVDNPTNALY